MIPFWLVVTVWAVVGSAGVIVLFLMVVSALVDLFAGRDHGNLSPTGEHPYEVDR